MRLARRGLAPTDRNLHTLSFSLVAGTGGASVSRQVGTGIEDGTELTAAAGSGSGGYRTGSAPSATLTNPRLGGAASDGMSSITVFGCPAASATAELNELLRGSHGANHIACGRIWRQQWKYYRRRHPLCRRRRARPGRVGSSLPAPTIGTTAVSRYLPANKNRPDTDLNAALGEDGRSSQSSGWMDTCLPTQLARRSRCR